MMKMYLKLNYVFSNRISSFFKGFYTVYNKLFRDIAEQDLKASNNKKIEIPEFGNSTSDYEEVRKEKRRCEIIVII